MPSCWKFLYRPKSEGESEEDKLMRRLSFKLPIVFRYSVFFAFAFGLMHAFVVKRMRVVKYWTMLIPFEVGGLCYEEIWKYMSIRGNA